MVILHRGQDLQWEWHRSLPSLKFHWKINLLSRNTLWRSANSQWWAAAWLCFMNLKILRITEPIIYERGEAKEAIAHKCACFLLVRKPRGRGCFTGCKLPSWIFILKRSLHNDNLRDAPSAETPGRQQRQEACTPVQDSVCCLSSWALPGEAKQNQEQKLPPTSSSSRMTPKS